eukprot:Awhi_evm1s5613
MSRLSSKYSFISLLSRERCDSEVEVKMLHSPGFGRQGYYNGILEAGTYKYIIKMTEEKLAICKKYATDLRNTTEQDETNNVNHDFACVRFYKKKLNTPRLEWNDFSKDLYWQWKTGDLHSDDEN